MGGDGPVHREGLKGRRENYPAQAVGFTRESSIYIHLEKKMSVSDSPVTSLPEMSSKLNLNGEWGHKDHAGAGAEVDYFLSGI